MSPRQPSEQPRPAAAAPLRWILAPKLAGSAPAGGMSSGGSAGSWLCWLVATPQPTALTLCGQWKMCEEQYKKRQGWMCCCTSPPIAGELQRTTLGWDFHQSSDGAERNPGWLSMDCCHTAGHVLSGGKPHKSPFLGGG